MTANIYQLCKGFTPLMVFPIAFVLRLRTNN
jgi:hypothetical protein